MHSFVSRELHLLDHNALFIYVLLQTLKVASKREEPVVPLNVKPLDMKHHRRSLTTKITPGLKTPRANSTSSSHLTVMTPRTENRTKTELSDAIKAYTAGYFNVGQFRLALAGKVKIDSQLERLLRQHEAGDEQSYAAFGKLIFR